MRCVECPLQVVTTELMTDSDMWADALVSPALQACLVMLSSSESEGLTAAADLLQYLTPAQKHLTVLQRYIQVDQLSRQNHL